MRPGDLIADRFEIGAIAGSGGMGRIFRATDRVTLGQVALKVLLDGREDHERRFEREASVLSELEHPGVVRYVAHGTTRDGDAFLAMEWLDGEDLAATLARRRLTLDECLTLAARVAEILGAVHARGVVHRDLKPANLFLPGGRVDAVKVLDFGVAWLASAARMTMSGAFVGTPGYLAPEQVRSGEAVDARADVFALGCVLFECLTGTPSFRGDHVMAVLAKILFEDAPPLLGAPPGAPRGLEALVARMLAKDPALRPRDGGAVAEALAKLDASAADPASDREEALTRDERRLLSILLVGPAAPADTLAPSPLGHTVAAPTSVPGDRLRAVAEAHGGRFERLQDGAVVVALTGTGVATDLASQAARCALALRAAAGDRPSALATGRVDLSHPLLLGDAIDRATRMLDRARGAEAPSPIWIDDVTSGLLDARFEVGARAAGLALLGERPLAEGTRTLLGRATRCVGRERELATLDALWAECVDEARAHAVLMTAPAGMGKSRLASEAIARITGSNPGVAVWSGRVDSLRAGSPFALLGQALRAALDLHDGEPLGSRRQRLLDRVAERAPAGQARRIAEGLGELTDTPFPDDESAPLRAARRDNTLMADQLRRAFLDFLRAETAAAPVLIVLEDLHWGDLSTMRFVGDALREVRDRPFLVLALARPEVHDRFPRLWDGRGVQEIRLVELSRRASASLVRQVLGDVVDPAIVERITSLADGHAFYLEELIRAVAEGRDGALPETVLAMVQARVEGLDPEARRVLRAASVFGEVSWRGGVAALLGEASERAGQTLEALVDRELLVRGSEGRFPGEPELSFRHALLREGAYAMLTDEDRALGHRLAGHWLEAHGERDALVLAEHFERGGEPVRAGRYYLRAAEHALRGIDMSTALERAERGLRSGAPMATRASLLGLICEAHIFRHELVSAVGPYAQEAMRIAAPGSAVWAQAASATLFHAAQTADGVTLTATLGALEAVEPTTEAMGHTALLFASGVYICDLQGDLLGAARLLRRFHAVVDPITVREPHAAAWLAVIHALRDGAIGEDPTAGLAAAARSELLFLEVNHHNGAAAARVLGATNLWFLGQPEEAERRLRAEVVADEDLGVTSSARPFVLACLLAERGALDEARAVAERLISTGTERGLPLDEARGRWAFAQVCEAGGALDEAERAAISALHGLAVSALDHLAATATLASIQLAAGRVTEARTTAEDAWRRLERTGGAAFQRGAAVRLVLAEALHAEGDEARASAMIVEAAARIHALAGRIGDASSRARYLDGVPAHRRTLTLADAWRAR